MGSAFGWIRAVALAAALSAVGLGAASGQGAVSGIVKADRGGPLPGVEILVQNQPIRAVTGPDGRFRIDSIPAGVQVIVFRKIGYRPQALTLAISAEARPLGAVVLEAGAFRLPELAVTVSAAKPARYANTTKYDDFYRRRSRAGGIFLDREALEQRFEMYTHQILQGLPGVKVANGPPGTGSQVWFSRCNETPPAIALYVDGIRMIPPWGIARAYGLERRTVDRGVARRVVDDRISFVEEMLDTVSPVEIEAMEVFKGPAQLPAEFNGGDNCGAIVIWTRQGGFRAVDSTGAR